MHLKRLKLSVIFLSGLALAGLQAQESVNATGGNTSGIGGSVSYSVGQIVCQTQTGTELSVAEGVQQPYEISVSTGIKKAKGINLSASVYPNPTTDYLILEIKDLEFTKLSFQLYDMNGKLLQSEKIITEETQINIDELVPASYILKVIKHKKSIKEFKIVKK